MTLGFGGSGTDLAKAWTITDQGSEPISDGMQTVKTEKLDLVSKDPSIRGNFSHITIWVDPARDVSLKQVSYQPSGDTRTVYFTNIRLNQPVDTKPFAINCKGKCVVVQH
jgi:outer membrane lipoprotein-sorting protein